MCALLYSFLFLYIVCLWIVNLVVAEFVCAMPEYYLFIFQKKKFIEKKKNKKNTASLCKNIEPRNKSWSVSWLQKTLWLF